MERILVGGTDQRERRKRRREIAIAAFGVALIVILTLAELRSLGLTWLGLNLNFFMLLLVIFVVGRNSVKLILERRRKVLGSKLRSRLVLAFLLLSLVPTVLMFIISVKFVQTSVNYWFKAQADDSMQQALNLGRSLYASAQERMERRGGLILSDLQAQGLHVESKAAARLLEERLRLYDLAFASLVSPDGSTLARVPEQGMDPEWKRLQGRIDWDSLRAQPRFWSTILPSSGSDAVVGILPLDMGRGGFLVVGEVVGQGLMYRLDKVARGMEEYRKLKSLLNPWKLGLYVTLGLMASLIILGSMWFGFRLAKELSAPVQALAAGTERVARGDLSVRLEDRSDDELGLLVRSFNRMTEDLSESQTSLTQANEQLARQNVELERRGRYIEALLDNITSGVVSMDPEGRIGTVNKAAQRMLGVHSSLLIGNRPGDLLKGEFAALMNEAIETVRQAPDSLWQRAIDLPLRARTVKLLVSVLALKSETGEATGIVTVFEDITELEKIQRLAAWREVARRIAHEIKNPLTPIKLSAQRLQRKFGDSGADPAFRECTDLIVRQVERMQQMVTEFSSYAKLPEVTLRPQALTPIVDESVQVFAATHRGISWKVDMGELPGQIPLDAEAMRRVLLNLLTNAAEALEGRSDGEVAVRVRHDKPRAVVTLTVMDNGPGFTPEERSRMFEPYYSRKKSGTGLGLTIVRSIVNDHKGQIRVEPNQPQGAMFIVDIPVA